MDFEKFLKKGRLVVVGLGYVGLPLAISFAKHISVIGFDINKKLIEKLKKGERVNQEVDFESLKNLIKKKKIEFSSDLKRIKKGDVVIISVPTPVDKLKDPDLSYVKSASKIVGRNLKKGATVVYESTVWPGLTEEICVPILEKESGLTWKKDFFVGYSPERINPGDREHTLENIVKVVAGDTPETTEFLKRLYSLVVKAGVYAAPDIKTAEAAKVIENIQRDINIALVNEFALIFHKLGLNTKEILKAAGTKWNFLPFEPGFVGGHCIGVDPYYLAYKAREAGYIPQLILAGRHINEFIPHFVAEEILKLLAKARKNILGAKVLVLGFTFKENVPDVRNTKVYDMVKHLRDFGIISYIYDPVADREAARKEYQIELIEDFEDFSPYDAVILAVRHKVFLEGLKLDKIKELCTKPEILVDVKGVYFEEAKNERNLIYWTL